MSYKVDLGKAVLQIVVKRCSGTDREYVYVYVPGKLSVHGKKDIMDILRFEKALESLAKQFKPAKMSGDDFEKEVKLALKLVPLDKNDEVVEQLSSDQIQAKYAHLKEDADIIFEEEIPGKEQRIGGNKELQEEVMEDIEENEENNGSMTSPSGEQTSKNKDENSQDGSGQDSDVGSAEKTQKSGKFSEWQKVFEWVAGKESRTVVCNQIPKNSKPEDCATFFRQYDAEDWKRNPGNFKSVCAYTVIFKTVEAANEFLNLAKVMYGNVELGRLTHRDHHTLNKMEKWNVVLTATQRHLRRLHEFVTTKTGLLSDSVPSAQMVLVSNFPKETTHLQVRQFVSDEENNFKDISGIFRTEENMDEHKGNENRKFLRRYVFLFSSVQSAELFVQSKLDFENTRLRATLLRDLVRHINVMDQVKNFIDDGEDAEASPKQRAVVLGHIPTLDPTDEFEAKLRKHLKSVRGMFLCSSSCIMEHGHNKYIVTFKNVMAARSATKSEHIESDAFKSRLLIYSLDEYLRIRELFVKRRTKLKRDSSCNNYFECFKVEDESILKIQSLKYKCSSTQTTITTKHQIRTGDRMKLLGLAPGEFDDLVICKFANGVGQCPKKGQRIVKAKDILAYMKDNHPGCLKVHEFKSGLFFLRFKNGERAEEFHDLPYCYYMENPVERFRIWDYLGDDTMASLYRHEITPHLYPERDIKLISGAYVGIDVIGYKHMEDSEKKATEDKMKAKVKDVPVSKVMWVGETENPVLRIIIQEEVEVVVKQIRVFMHDPDRNKLQFILYKESQENMEKRKREESKKRRCSESDPVSSKRR